MANPNGINTPIVVANPLNNGLVNNPVVVAGPNNLFGAGPNGLIVAGNNVLNNPVLITNGQFCQLNIDCDFGFICIDDPFCNNVTPFRNLNAGFRRRGRKRDRFNQFECDLGICVR